MLLYSHLGFLWRNGWMLVSRRFTYQVTNWFCGSNKGITENMPCKLQVFTWYHLRNLFWSTLSNSLLSRPRREEGRGTRRDVTEPKRRRKSTLATKQRLLYQDRSPPYWQVTVTPKLLLWISPFQSRKERWLWYLAHRWKVHFRLLALRLHVIRVRSLMTFMSQPVRCWSLQPMPWLIPGAVLFQAR